MGLFEGWGFYFFNYHIRMNDQLYALRKLHIFGKLGDILSHMHEHHTLRKLDTVGNAD